MCNAEEPGRHQGPKTTLLEGNVSGLPSDLLKPLQESCIKKLVMKLVEVMRGVTNHHDNKWLWAIKGSVSMVQKITGTLALGATFPTKTDTLHNFAKGRKIHYHTSDHIQSLVKEVEGILLWHLQRNPVIHEILHYEMTDKSMIFQRRKSDLRSMANARNGVSLHELYCKTREERRDGGFSGILD
ncbi:hypothetical protein F5141DRAFT_1065847 [Pisolithus sp. B1]|nr:hypothetical protein F5141DRAFT_1065847 [Pisolithus sp. B1]